MLEPILTKYLIKIFKFSIFNTLKQRVENQRFLKWPINLKNYSFFLKYFIIEIKDEF